MSWSNKYMSLISTPIINTILSPTFTNILLALVISGLLTKLLTTITECIVMPLLSLFSKNKKSFQINPIISHIIVFIITIYIIYYFFIIPLEKLRTNLGISKSNQIPCPYCMTLINNNAARCPACTSQLNKNEEENVLNKPMLPPILN